MNNRGINQLAEITLESDRILEQTKAHVVDLIKRIDAARLEGAGNPSIEMWLHKIYVLNGIMSYLEGYIHAEDLDQIVIENLV